MAGNGRQTDSSCFPSYSSNPSWNHDVFLSFRGEDTRKNFTDHLYTALDRAGIHTFMDDHEIPRGKEILPELLKAIQESRISIVVFSKNYASSRWCLEELRKIIECKTKMGQVVMPIFYHIDPSHVRKQRGSYGKAFARHESYVAEMEKVKSWRAALSEAANLSGWDLQNVADGRESKFIKKIVEEVQLVVNHEYLSVAVHPVGIHSRVEEVKSLLSIGSGGVRIIGIYGMGGIGKTTIAKALYNIVFHLFESSCFISNVQKVSEQVNGVARLQEILLSEILRKKKFKIWDVDRGTSLIKHKLRSKRVLLVLDDLNELSLVYSLAGQHDWFGSGSRIMVTTRNEHLLRGPNVDESYEATVLNNIESMELFCWHAFRKTFPLKEYMKLSIDIVRYAEGLPLALEVLGSHLFGRTVVEWKSAFQKLRRIPHSQIQQTLRISFDQLDVNEKEIFLDISCFFIGMDKDYVINILNGCGLFAEIGISVLVSRCLLKIGKNNELQMHDLIMDMGREIIHEESLHEPEKRSRLWVREDVLDVLKQQKGTDVLKGVFLEQTTTAQVNLSTKTFERMHNLRLLKINNVNLTGSFKDLFKELRWLSWHHCNLERLPSDFRPQKLVILDMRYNVINSLWYMKYMRHLKTLNLSYSKFLRMTPDFTEVAKLETLLLEGCHNLCELHPSIGLLDRLVELDLKDCRNLRYLPSSICNLRSLEHLNLNRCRNFEGFPKQLGNMECLKELSANFSAINHLPDSIGFLGRLVALDLKGCQKLRNLPSSIGNLKSLERLNLYGCSNLEQLPEQLGNMESLWELRADYISITQLPVSVGLLSSLVRLNLGGCRIKNLPDGFCNLRTLEILDLNGCRNLKRLPEPLGNMESLRVLDACGTGIRQSPDPTISQLSNLKVLWLSYCVSLPSLPELPPNLVTLNASDCISMEQLPDLSHLKQLEELYLENWRSLSEIPGLENLNSVRRLRLNGCRDLATTSIDNFIRGRCERGMEIQIHLSRGGIPDWFSHKRMGSTISFDMPLQWKNRFVGMIFWAAYAANNDKVTKYHVPKISIRNRTNDTTLTERYEGITINSGEHSFVASIPLNCNFKCNVKGGDNIEVCIEEDIDVKVEYGIHLVFKPDVDEINGGQSCIVNENVDGIDDLMSTTHSKRRYDVPLVESTELSENDSKKLRLEHDPKII